MSKTCSSLELAIVVFCSDLICAHLLSSILAPTTSTAFLPSKAPIVPHFSMGCPVSNPKKNDLAASNSKQQVNPSHLSLLQAMAQYRALVAFASAALFLIVAVQQTTPTVVRA